MNIFIKLISIVVTLVVLVFAGAAIFISTLDLNDYKEKIATEFKKTTGRSLSINGNISSQIFPTLSLDIKDVVVGNARQYEQYGDFASIEQVNAGVKVLPLLSGNIELSDINLIGFKAALVASNNSNNWDFTNPDAQKVTSQKNENQSSNNGTLPNIKTGSINIENAKISYLDLTTKNKTTLDPVNLKLSEFKFDDPFNMKLSSVVTGKSIPNGSLALGVNSNITIKNNAKEIKLDDVEILLNDQKISGNLDIINSTKPNISIALKGSNFDVNKILGTPETAKDTSNKKSIDNKSKEQPIDLAFLKDFDFSGDLSFDRLIYDVYQLDALKAKVVNKSAVLNLSELSFNIFDGAFKGAAQIDAKTNTPRFSANGEASSLAMAKITEVLAGEQYVTAVMNSAYNIKTAGRVPSQLTKNLNGKIDFALGDGVIQKWNLSKKLNQLIAFLETGSIQPSNNDEFKFTSMNATANISNGIISNQDLKVLAPLVNFNGVGQINLPAERIDYTIEPILGEGLLEKSSVRTVPVKVSGTFTQPEYKLDLQSALKGTVKDKLQEKLNNSGTGQKIKEKLDGFLGEGAGSSLIEGLPF